MDADLAKMRRYLLHHRIATYAIVLFLVLVTFILISISKQVQDEQALILNSQASAGTYGRTQSQTMGRRGTCPANGMPARIAFDGPEEQGSSSCYFGQFRYVSVRCNDGERSQIIYATNVGSGSRCAVKSDLVDAAKARCGCTGQNGGNNRPTGMNFPSLAPTGMYFPTNGPTLTIPSPTRVPYPRLTLTCKVGVPTHDLVAGTCDPNTGTFNSINFTCLNGYKGKFSYGSLTCSDADDLYDKAYDICKTKQYCLPPKPSATPANQ